MNLIVVLDLTGHSVLRGNASKSRFLEKKKKKGEVSILLANDARPRPLGGKKQSVSIV